MKAWQALKNYQPATAPFRAWLYRIAHNTVVDYYRTQKETVQWDDSFTVVDSTNAPERILLKAERQAAVHNAVETLNPSYRDVITHRFIYDKDYAETAEALDRNINNVRVLQHSCVGCITAHVASEQPDLDCHHHHCDDVTFWHNDCTGCRERHSLVNRSIHCASLWKMSNWLWPMTQ